MLRINGACGLILFRAGGVYGEFVVLTFDRKDDVFGRFWQQ
jgi:hypothetical protein